MGPVIDADGHIFEDAEAIWQRMPSGYRTTHRGNYSLFPELDNVHIAGGHRPPGSFDYTVDAAAWVRFADALGITAAVLYPSAGLAYGRIRHLGWARSVARAYNDWLAAEYLARSPRLRGMALIPLQDPPAAVAELRRAVTELGMCGAVFPANGLNGLFGDPLYRPVFAAADELGCTIAVHGGSYAGLALEQMNTLAGAHALGHPLGNMLHFVSMTLNGTFDDYPNVRFAFLEAGVAWLPFVLERLEGSYRSFIPFDLDADLVRLNDGETIRERLIGHLRSGRISIGIEGDERDLPYAVQTIGREPFVFSTDFPHEVNLEICRHEIEEIAENPSLTDDEKSAILHDNAARLYNLRTPAELR